MSKPIPVSQATAMLKTYNTYMQTLGVDMKKQTQSVSFNLTELMGWLNKMTAIADELRVFMADYPAGHPEAGRTTVVLWPYKDGQPAKTTDRSLATETGEIENGEDPEDPEEPGDPGDGEDPEYPGNPPGEGDPADPFNDGKLNP
jgi:hypothetical protein